VSVSRINVSEGLEWESTIGYARAVRVGSHIAVSGTTAAAPGGGVIGEGDVYAQAMAIFRKVESALAQAGASMSDVVRTRMFITNIDDWQALGRAHAEFFRDIRPAATMVEVTRLIDPRLLVEIEVDAFVAEG
jgi:enamine deaminase RidA (YjgF/YER057c/UK114 family)